MRVTQWTLYNNFVINQQKTLSDLQQVQEQIATGKKITYMYDDPVVFTKFLKFDEEINSFEQIKSSATFAKTFAQESDTTLNDIVSTLISFKTKLLNAANDTNNHTSRMAIASELKGELEHLKDLANTSIDGKYIFSGSAFDKKPISDDYEYQGNDKYVKAFLGAGVEREYNIPGSELFLGRDDDYNKHTTLNVVQFNKMKLYPEFVVRGADGKLYIDKNNPNPDELNPAIQEPVGLDTPLRGLTGVEDIDRGNGIYEDGVNLFFIKGKKPNGEFINTSFTMSNSDSVADLLERIGEEFGNTATTKVVDVTINDMGQIQIKDLNSGKMITDFYMVATNYDKDNPTNNPQTPEDIVKMGRDLIEFQKSNFNSIRDLTSIKANNSYFDNRVFKFGAEFKTLDTKREALGDDLVYNVLGEKGINSNNQITTLTTLEFVGTSTDNSNVNVTLNIDNTTTMNDILKTIKDNFGNVDVRLDNGEIIITDKDAKKTEKSNFSLKIKAFDENGNELEVFASKDSANFDKLLLEKNADELKGNVENVENDKIYYYKNGELKIKNNENAQNYITSKSVVANSIAELENKKEFEIRYIDKNGEFKKAVITLRDNEENGHLSTFWVDLNNDGVEDSNEVFDIFNENGELTPQHTNITTSTELDPITCQLCTKEDVKEGVTYSQLSDIVSMLVSDNLPTDNNYKAYKEAIENAKEDVEVGVDEKGRFYIKDLKNANTKIDFSFYDLSGNNSLYFQANNAITIDKAQVDFFKVLEDAITAVENGRNYADSNSPDPRNFGIQGAIEAIEHVMDRVRRSHAKIGAIGNEFDMTIQRVEMLKVNVESLQSDNIDTDIAEASMRLNSLTTSYQALLASIAKVNNLTLLNYLR